MRLGLLFAASADAIFPIVRGQVFGAIDDGHCGGDCLDGILLCRMGEYLSSVLSYCQDEEM